MWISAIRFPRCAAVLFWYRCTESSAQNRRCRRLRKERAQVHHMCSLLRYHSGPFWILAVPVQNRHSSLSGRAHPSCSEHFRSGHRYSWSCCRQRSCSAYCRHHRRYRLFRSQACCRHTALRRSAFSGCCRYIRFWTTLRLRRRSVRVSTPG